MKTSRIIIAAVAIAAAVSCNKESFNNENVKEEVTIITGAKTRTSLEGKEIHWTSDDQIAVFDNTGARNIFGITESEGSYATFSGSVTSGTTQIYAVYPENLAVSAAEGNFKVNLPADQTSKAGSFAEEHNISVAKAAKVPGNETITGVTFKNVCGLIRFTIPAYIEDAQSVTFESNSVIAGELTVDYTGDAPSVSTSDAGSRSVTMTGSYPAGSEFIFVLAPGTIDGFTITVTTAKATWSISKDVDIELQAGRYRNLGTLELAPAETVSASSAHTYENGILTGTAVTVNLNIPESTLKYVTGLRLTVENEDGEVVRTYEKNGASAVETLSPDADQEWPYLPKGTYYVSGEYTLSGKTVKELGTVSFTNTEDPVFSVECLAYSSYTKYLAGDIDAANGCDAETIYDMNKASVTIADYLMNNKNYKQGFTYIYNDAAIMDETVSGLDWGPHSVTATYNFDGYDASDIADCHITGLPFNAAPPVNSGELAWSTNSGDTGIYKIKWNDDCVKLEGESKKQTLTSPGFNIPGNTNVKMTVSTLLHTISVVHIYAIPHLICRIGGSEVISREGTKGQKDWKGSSENNENYTGSGTGTLTTATNTVQVENSYTMASAYINVYSVRLEYN